jgi:predicted N-acetyltransferase YhbS
MEAEGGFSMIKIREATRSDNEGLLSLTSVTPMSGEISIRSDRYPDFFRLLDRRGRSQVLVAEKGGVIVGCVSTACVQAYVDGAEEPVRYLGDLKAHPDFQKTGLAVRLLKAMHERLLSANADLVVCTAAYGNKNILPFFDGRAGLPKAAALGVFNVHQILPSARLRITDACDIREEPESPDLYRLYSDHFRHYQFGPVFQPGTLQEARHWVARSGGGIVACLSLVDIADARQNVLIRLPPFLRGLTAIWRSIHRVFPVTDLPGMNEPVRILYIKALACREGQEKALDLLIQKARNVAFARRYHFLAIGVHERDPMRQRIMKYPKFTFRSLGFVIALKRGHDEVSRLTQEVPYEDYSLV